TGHSPKDVLLTVTLVTSLAGMKPRIMATSAGLRPVTLLVGERKMAIIKDSDKAVSVREMQEGLERLERREWWRWGVALLIMLLLTFGVFALSLSGVRKEVLNDFQFEPLVPGLFALVLVFDFFAIYQQVLISRLRRQLSSQIGMMGALEAIKPI